MHRGWHHVFFTAMTLTLAAAPACSAGDEADAPASGGVAAQGGSGDTARAGASGAATAGGAGGSVVGKGGQGGSAGNMATGGSAGTGPAGAGGSAQGGKGGGAGEGAGGGAGQTGQAGAAGAGEGGSAQGGSAQGGSAQGGSAQGGSGDAGAAQAGGGEAGSAGANVGGGHAFGTHGFAYAPGVLMPSAGAAERDAVTAAFYDDVFKKKYVKKGCGGYYVHSGGGTGSDVGDTVSEGHGYGMVVVAMMAGHDPDAQAIFDGMVAFFKKFQDSKGMMAWTVDVAGGCKVPSGGNDSATDGDLDVAFALLLASAQWGNGGAIDYKAEADKLLPALLKADINASTHLPYLGDWAKGDATYGLGTRPSDFMQDHFKAFGAATGDGAWGNVVDSVYDLVGKMQTNHAPSTGLLPDFIVKTDTSPKPAAAGYLEGPTDGEYAYNACRVPWRLAADLVVSGDPRASAALEPLNAWIKQKTGGNPAKIKDGYQLDGTAGTEQSGPSTAFSAPFGAAAMAGTDQAWLDALWQHLATSPSEGYYEDSIKMQVLLLMSGNWWAP